MVGKKGYKNSDNQIEVNAKIGSDNLENSQFILDLDELHLNVTPPSELNENCSPKTEDKRKKVRHHRHILNFAVDTQHANNKCHQCRRKNLKYGLFKCSRKECSILYCAICIKKYNQQFNTCFYCQRVCKCKVCRNKFDIHNKNDELSEEDDYFSFDEKNMVKIDDFIVVEQKDSELDFDENIPVLLEIKKKPKTKTRKYVKKEFKKKKTCSNQAKNGNKVNVDNNKNNITNEKELKISFDDGINLNEEKNKNKKSYKIKNMRGEQGENIPYTDKGSEKFNSENFDKDNSSVINGLKDNLKPESIDYYKDDSLIVDKLSEKLPNDDKLNKNYKKNKIKKNETLNLIPNNLIQINNAINNSNKKEKNKKDKAEKLEKMDRTELKLEGENSNPVNNDCIKNIEIPSNNYIKSKKSVYKNCLYCKNDKMNIMTILRFKSSEEFIFYSKHFYEKLSDESLKIYKESKNNFERYYNDYYKKCSQSNNFTFKSIKYICMSCFEENLKDENGFSNILNTLQYGLNPAENKIPVGKHEENNNNHHSNLNENIIENKSLNMEPNIDLNFTSGEKLELLKQKKKYIKKRLNNNQEEEKVQNYSNTPVNLTNLSNNLESNTDKDIINNLINYNKIKKLQMNENNNNISSNNNQSNNFNSMNSNMKAQNNNATNSNNHIFPSITLNNPFSPQNTNSQTINNLTNLNAISSQENNNNLNNLINSTNTNILKNALQIPQNQNSIPNITQNQIIHNNNNDNNYNLNNTSLNIIANSNNINAQNKSQIPNNQNNNNNIIINNSQNQSLNDNNNLNTDSKLDNLNNLISQGIDELYNTTKENLGNLNDGGMNVTNMIMNFDQNKEDLSNKLNLKNILDDLKKQFFSINYYSLLQKLFMSYIFKNLETFVEQISKNQYLGDFIINSIIQTVPKLQDSNEIKNNPNSLQINTLINNINDQISSLRNTNNQGQLLTTSLNGVFDELKLNGNKIFENIEAGNKGNNIDGNNPFNISNMNIDSNNFDILMKNGNKNQINQNCNFLNSTNISQIPLSNNSNMNQQLFGGLNANEILSNNNNQNTQSLNQNENPKNNFNNNSNNNRENINNHIHNSEISQNNLNNLQNKNTTNFNNDMVNLLNSSNKNMESKDKIQSNLNNSLTHNILIQNNLNSNLEKDLRLQHSNNNSSHNINNLINNNSSLIQNMMGIGSMVNPNQVSLQASSGQLQTNISSPLNLSSNNQNQQMQMLEKIMNQKNNVSNLNKLNQQQYNLIPDLASISMLSSGGTNNNLSLMGNYIPNLHKPQGTGNITNINPLLGMNSMPLNIQSLNNPSLNNHLLQQQQQNLQLLNVNNHLLPMQLGGIQYINPLTQSLNMDLLNKLQGGVSLNNMQSVNGMLANPQLGLMSGLNLNQRLILEGNNQQNLLNTSMLNPLDLNLQMLKKFNNNENE